MNKKLILLTLLAGSFGAQWATNEHKKKIELDLTVLLQKKDLYKLA